MTVPPRRRVALLAAAVAVLLGGGAYYWWAAGPRSTLDPPSIDEAGVDPEVVKAVRTAHAGVLADRNSADAWGHYGLVLFAHAFWVERDVCLAEAARLNPADPRWPYLIGMGKRTEDEAAAVEWFQRAADAKPADPARAVLVRLRLAEALLQVQRYDDAERLFRAERAADPANLRAALGLGTALAARGQPREAVEPLTAAMAAPEARRRARTLLAAVARQTADEATAARLEAEALRLPEDASWTDPFVAPVAELATGRKERLRQAGRLKAAGRVRDSIRAYEQLAREQPDVITLSRFAEALVGAGQFAAAERPLREVLKLEPDHPFARYQLGYALTRVAVQQEEPQRTATLREAIDLLNQAVALKPDLGMAYAFRGEAEYLLGDLPAAAESMRKAVACRPDQPSGHEGLVTVLEKANRIAEAKAALAAAEKVLPADTLQALRERLKDKN